MKNKKNRFYDFMASLAFVFNVDWDDEYLDGCGDSDEGIHITEKPRIAYRDAG
ncbi:MAG: hypothetical protein ACOX6J_01745 [Oscillospiraceae bacterium]